MYVIHAIPVGARVKVIDEDEAQYVGRVGTVTEQLEFWAMKDKGWDNDEWLPLYRVDFDDPDMESSGLEKTRQFVEAHLKLV